MARNFPYQWPSRHQVVVVLDIGFTSYALHGIDERGQHSHKSNDMRDDNRLIYARWWCKAPFPGFSWLKTYIGCRWNIHLSCPYLSIISWQLRRVLLWMALVLATTVTYSSTNWSIGSLRAFGRMQNPPFTDHDIYTIGQNNLTYTVLSCLAQFGVKTSSDTFRSSFKVIFKSIELLGSFQYLDGIQCSPWCCVVMLYKCLIMTMVSSRRCSCRKKWCHLVNHVQPSTYCTLMLFGTLTVPSICEKIRTHTYAGLTG